MNLVWKPLDVMRQRLYHVILTWPMGNRIRRQAKEHRYVFADAPRFAAEKVADAYREMPGDQRPICSGHAINVGQPEEWFDDRRISPTACNHNFEVIQSSRGMQTDEWVAVCRDCGEIEVRVQCREKGFNHTVRLGIGCDDHLRHASKYLRSKAESEEALARAKRTGQQEPTE